MVRDRSSGRTKGLCRTGALVADPPKDLQSIDAALASIDPAQSGEYFGVQLMRQSLEQRRDQLLAEAYGSLQLRLTREGPAGSGAELSLVAGVLDSLQESIASIGQVIAGQATKRGLIPAAIKEEVELRVLAAQPGSLNLQLVPVAPTQEPLFDDEEGSLLELSMDRLLSLLSRGGGDPDLLQEVADLGPRVTTHVHDLAKVLAESDAAASLQWQSQNRDIAASVNTSDAVQLREILREVETENRELVFAGRLVGGSLVRGTFELELDDAGAEKTIIAGRVDEDALADLERLFGHWVTARVEVRASRLRSGETRESHLLQGLST
jgi:hypothetical protein